MNSLPQNLRFAFRRMRHSPGFAAAAILILALGIAVNVVVFGVLQPMILQLLDVPDPDRVVMTFAPHVADYPIFAYPCAMCAMAIRSFLRLRLLTPRLTLFLITTKYQFEGEGHGGDNQEKAW